MRQITLLALTLAGCLLAGCTPSQQITRPLTMADILVEPQERGEDAFLDLKNEQAGVTFAVKLNGISLGTFGPGASKYARFTDLIDEVSQIKYEGSAGRTTKKVRIVLDVSVVSGRAKTPYFVLATWICLCRSEGSVAKFRL